MSKTCYIQIRLPNGKAIKKKFEDSKTFSDVEKFVVENCSLSSGTFSLLSQYPKKEFSPNDFSKLILKDVKAVNPSGTLNVLKLSQKGKFSKGKDVFIGKVLHASSENEFNSILKKYPTSLIVVDFFSDTCPPCIALAPFIEKWAKQMKGVVFVKVDVKKGRNFAMKNGIKAMPTILFWKNGKILSQKQVGFNQNKSSEFEKLIASLK